MTSPDRTFGSPANRPPHDLQGVQHTLKMLLVEPFVRIDARKLVAMYESTNSPNNKKGTVLLQNFVHDRLAYLIQPTSQEGQSIVDEVLEENGALLVIVYRGRSSGRERCPSCYRASWCSRTSRLVRVRPSGQKVLPEASSRCVVHRSRLLEDPMTRLMSCSVAHRRNRLGSSFHGKP
eukprot:6005803-Pyramimonas_sp.AAC.1